MKPRIKPILLIAATIPLTSQLTGCLFVTTIYEEPKMEVSFSSAKAAQEFYEASYVPQTSSKNTFMMGVKIPIPSYSKLDGPLKNFNKAVRSADADGNLRITESEAAAYAETKRKAADPSAEDSAK